VAEMTLRLAGLWDTEADRAIEDLKEARLATVNEVFAEHPARRGRRPRPARQAGKTPRGRPRNSTI
jgi:hypothetical protein